jgi:2-octaprenyl-6-methoxyphenol hydroxylase
MTDRSQTVSQPTDCAVIGAGPAGLIAALALSAAGLRTVLIGPLGVRDNRTTALLGGSVDALEALGVWPLCRDKSAALSTMRIVDDTGRLLRAPEVRFESHEIGREAFGYNIMNHDLVAGLIERARSVENLTLIADDATNIVFGDEAATVTLTSGQVVSARLVVGADGRRSKCRELAGIDVQERRYPQSALTVSFSHTRPHRDISTEFHTPSGPFTLVPLPGNRSSLVWVLNPAQADDIGALDDHALAREIERRSQSLLGKITLEPGRGLFPLSAITARSFVGPRLALVGEAAHVIPPIGAQGLNLGLRDAAAIAEIAGDAHRAGDDIGHADVLARYETMRREDVSRRTMAVDLLNRSLLSEFLPIQGLRGLGLFMLDRIGPLRRMVMREGVSPQAQPRLMRGELI